MPLPRRPHVAVELTDDERSAASERFLATMRNRRSIRDFSPDPVPRELMVNAIRAAALAPSGANQQPWTFVLIGNEPELRARIREAAEAEEREGYGHRMSEEWLEALEPLGTDWHKPHLTDAPWLIVVFELAYGVRPDGTGKVKHYYVRESVGIAVGILLASLTHVGLATLTHTPSPMGFLADILGRPENERAYVVIPVGYAAADATVPDITRKSLDEVLVEIPRGRCR
ncbi:MAG TPA: nitroreductase family protein [Candidatus Limnocylindrales bacterium]|nr:nitroreductase family protein [Candidatus Limnocylindrales bacterium]